jgi:hypothetical protein
MTWRTDRVRHTRRILSPFVKVQGEAGEMKVVARIIHWFHWLIVRTSKGARSEQVKGGISTLQLRAFAKAITRK